MLYLFLYIYTVVPDVALSIFDGIGRNGCYSFFGGLFFKETRKSSSTNKPSAPHIYLPLFHMLRARRWRAAPNGTTATHAASTGRRRLAARSHGRRSVGGDGAAWAGRSDSRRSYGADTLHRPRGRAGLRCGAADVDGGALVAGRHVDTRSMDGWWGGSWTW